MTQNRARLGIDTGGTFTDAVLIDEDGKVQATAKSVTTRHDLSIGIGHAVRAVLDAHACRIDLVGLSTTLATNAIVEGRGGRVGLVMIGFGAQALARAGLDKALRGDPSALVAGGHDAHGIERSPLDHGTLSTAIDRLAGQADAIAITSAFAVRNPTHELAAAALVRERCGLPVTMSHELSAKLDGPKRALTTVLNARLVPEISRLLAAVGRLTAELGITAPVMVVRGDGSLMRAATVRHRPVETILSGPAASVVGAAKLGGIETAIIADVGGTTTDIALLQDGRPRLDPAGALVGGFRTMVEAIELRTSGLGGDSCLHRGPGDRLRLGPERSIPLSLLAHDDPSVLASLEAQAEREYPRALDAKFVRLVRRPDELLSKSQQALVDLLAAGPRTLEQVVEREHLEIPLRRLSARGIVALAGFTPSDAAHCLGLQATWDGRAAELGAILEARKQPASRRLDAHSLAQEVLRMARQDTALALVDAAAAADREPADGWLASAAIRRATDPGATAQPVLRLRLGLDRPIVAVGGPARLFYPQAARILDTELCLPEHYEVANAVGAVSGDVVRRLALSVTQIAEERYAWQLGSDRQEGHDAHALAALAEQALRAELSRLFGEAGGQEPEFECDREVKRAQLDAGREMIIEIRLEMTVRGRPRMA